MKITYKLNIDYKLSKEIITKCKYMQGDTIIKSLTKFSNGDFMLKLIGFTGQSLCHCYSCNELSKPFDGKFTFDSVSYSKENYKYFNNIILKSRENKLKRILK